MGVVRHPIVRWRKNRVQPPIRFRLSAFFLGPWRRRIGGSPRFFLAAACPSTSRNSFVMPGLGGLPLQNSEDHGHSMLCPHSLNTGHIAIICETWPEPADIRTDNNPQLIDSMLVVRDWVCFVFFPPWSSVMPGLRAPPPFRIAECVKCLRRAMNDSLCLGPASGVVPPATRAQIRQFPLISRTNSLNKYRESCGPGAASGWYCTQNSGSLRLRNPSRV